LLSKVYDIICGYGHVKKPVCQLRLPSLYDFEISETVNTKLAYSGLTVIQWIHLFTGHQYHPWKVHAKIEKKNYQAVFWEKNFEIFKQLAFFKHGCRQSIWISEIHFCLHFSSKGNFNYFFKMVSMHNRKHKFWWLDTYMQSLWNRTILLEYESNSGIYEW
jgi:hypothetical protein